jgi:hypothetical protein
MSSPFDRPSGSGRPGERADEAPARAARTRMEYAPQLDLRTTEPLVKGLGASAPTGPVAPQRSHTVFGHVERAPSAPHAESTPPRGLAQRAVVVRATVVSAAPPAVPDARRAPVPSPPVYGGAASPSAGSAPRVAWQEPPAPQPEPVGVTQPAAPRVRPDPPVAEERRAQGSLLGRISQATEFVDMHALVKHAPSASPGQRLRLGEDPHHAESSDVRAVRAPMPPRSDSGMRQRRVSAFDSDLERSIRNPVPRAVWLGGLCLLALGLMTLSFVYPSHEAPRPVANVSAQVSSPRSPSPSTAAAPRDTHVEPAMPAVRRPAEAALPTRTVSTETPRAELGGATQQSAAALYTKGQYKEALAEYRMLASTYPDQKVYAEFARILKRKLFDSCVRTQPNRREQCKQL